MGLYSSWVFPRLTDIVMSESCMTDCRRSLLKDVSGDVLEIGFGTGLNLPHYSSEVRSLTTVDPNAGMKAIAQKRIDTAPFPVHAQVLNGEDLPMNNDSFDSIVCTWTLCSIPNASKALQEAYRVLKPNGKFYFVEHGLSEEARIQTWQNRLTPIQKVLADGCHLNRKIDALIGEVFDEISVKEFYAPRLPKFIGYFYQGVATKRAASN